MAQKLIIHLGIDPKNYPDNAVDQVRSRAGDREVLVTTDREEIAQRVDSIEISLARFPHDLFAKAGNLQWYQQIGAGADWLEGHAEARELPFTLTSASGVHSIPISEHMFAFLLAIARGFPAAVRAQRDRSWAQSRERDVFELAGKRVLVLGVGAIGERFARLCEANDMEVVGLRRNPSKPARGVSRMVGLDDLHAELPHADVVANTLPLTAETRHFLARAEFAVIKHGSIVINIGRGATIDEVAMIEALRSGRLSAAGLDVFETEPLPEESPLWEMDNVLITAHYSGMTPRYNERVFEIFLDNLDRYLRGDPLRNVVDKSLGY